MRENNLSDPRKMYHTGKFPDQEQDTPALQKKMEPRLIAGKRVTRDIVVWRDEMH